jgi:hypothetical protein
LQPWNNTTAHCLCSFALGYFLPFFFAFCPTDSLTAIIYLQQYCITIMIDTYIHLCSYSSCIKWWGLRVSLMVMCALASLLFMTPPNILTQKLGWCHIRKNVGGLKNTDI